MKMYSPFKPRPGRSFMFLLIKFLLTNWYMLLIYRNHLIYWIEDNMIERIHVGIDRLDSLYWRAFWRLIS